MGKLFTEHIKQLNCKSLMLDYILNNEKIKVVKSKYVGISSKSNWLKYVQKISDKLKQKDFNGYISSGIQLPSGKWKYTCFSLVGEPINVYNDSVETDTTDYIYNFCTYITKYKF